MHWSLRPRNPVFKMCLNLLFLSISVFSNVNHSMPMIILLASLEKWLKNDKSVWIVTPSTVVVRIKDHVMSVSGEFITNVFELKILTECPVCFRKENTVWMNISSTCIYLLCSHWFHHYLHWCYRMHLSQARLNFREKYHK